MAVTQRLFASIQYVAVVFFHIITYVASCCCYYLPFEAQPAQPYVFVVVWIRRQSTVPSNSNTKSSHWRTNTFEPQPPCLVCIGFISSVFSFRRFCSTEAPNKYELKVSSLYLVCETFFCRCVAAHLKTIYPRGVVFFVGKKLSALLCIW